MYKRQGVRSDDEIAVIIPCDGGIDSGCVCNRNLILYKLCYQCGINGVSDRHNDFVVAKIHQRLVAADESAVLTDRAGLDVYKRQVLIRTISESFGSIRWE